MLASPIAQPHEPMSRLRGPVTVFDIETTATDEAYERIMTERYDPASFKPKNNAKDPAVIARQQQEAEAAFEAERQQRANDLALSPRTGRIICVGSVTPETQAAGHVAQDERTLLDHAWQLITDSSLLVTFNGSTFDIPFLITRSVLMRVRPAASARHILPLLKRYQYSPHLDIRQALNNWDRFAPGTLADWASDIGVPVPTGAGSEVGGWWREKNYKAIAEHCSGDVRATLALYQVVAPFFVEAA